jgi:hypothetical protein
MMARFAGIRPAKTRSNQNEWDKEFQMFRKGMSAAVVAACVMAAGASTANAHQTGAIGSETSDFSLAGWLFGGLTAPVPPETNPPGPRPPPKLDGSDPVTNPGNEGPHPPIR